MDLRAGRLPQSSSSSSTTTSSNNPFNGTEAIRTNEPNKFTFKDVYDYLSWDVLTGLAGGSSSSTGGGGGGASSDLDLLYPFGLDNYTLDGDTTTGLGGSASGVVGGAALAATLNQSTTIFQNVNGSAWNSTTLWLANGSLLAATAATTASSSVGVGSGGGGVGTGTENGEEMEISGILVTAATSIILGLMILITVIGE